MIQGMACKNAHNLHNKKDVPWTPDALKRTCVEATQHGARPYLLATATPKIICSQVKEKAEMSSLFVHEEDERVPLTSCVVYPGPSLEQAYFLNLHMDNRKIFRPSAEVVGSAFEAPGVGSKSVCGGTMTMEVTVNGRDANQEELKSLDWVTKVSKHVAELQESQQRERDGATRAASTSSGCGKEGRTMPAGFNDDKHGASGRPSYKAAGKKLAKRSVASHLPRLPNADHKVIMRPKERLTLTRQSAPVIGGAVRMAAGISWQKGREEDRIVVNHNKKH
ncbi:hypothetical protein HPB51_000722 [Rhipicephalus microplus]|uniref:Uncharacterized protein n=1 Tax=Rhipicephalus microplus TaxID=6941 RepID=A0A9J6ER22_RHIMP|nr:hypothetical protein HPB51_000722 [Rhipicephalus microplus]